MNSNKNNQNSTKQSQLEFHPIFLLLCHKPLMYHLVCITQNLQTNRTDPKPPQNESWLSKKMQLHSDVEINGSGPTLYTNTHTCIFIYVIITLDIQTRTAFLQSLECLQLGGLQTPLHHIATGHSAFSTQSRLEISNRRKSVASKVNPSLKTQSAVRKRQLWNTFLKAQKRTWRTSNKPLLGELGLYSAHQKVYLLFTLFQKKKP